MTMTALRHVLSVRADAPTCFHALFAKQPHPLWFDRHGERGTGVSYLAAGNALPLEQKTWRESVRAAHSTLLVESGLELGDTPLGLVLVVPYELAMDTLGVPLVGEQTPRAFMVDRVIEVHHDSHEVVLWELVEPGVDGESSVQQIESTLRRAAGNDPEPLQKASGQRWRDSRADYLSMIRDAQSAIGEGDAYQLCVTTQLTVEGQWDPVSLHRAVRDINPTHHQALIGLGDVTLVSASPETFLTLSPDGKVFTRPMKGTRPRGATVEEDEALTRELRTSEKECAENLMIVDLMRNDLSKVCEVGSVSVPELLVVETYASVHQLVSTVSGVVQHGRDFLDVLDATFPAGSMTGAPKRRAVELLSTLESGPRGWYSGCYGVWRADGSAEMAMTIRTAVVNETGFTVGVGGGITALSDPEFEISEVGVKARHLLRAVGEDVVQYS